MRAAMFALMFFGCVPLHTNERAQNTLAAAGYAAALELCVQTALDEISSGIAAETVQARYDACAASADRQFGKKP